MGWRSIRGANTGGGGSADQVTANLLGPIASGARTPSSLTRTDTGRRGLTPLIEGSSGKGGCTAKAGA